MGGPLGLLSFCEQLKDHSGSHGHADAARSAASLPHGWASSIAARLK